MNTVLKIEDLKFKWKNDKQFFLNIESFYVKERRKVVLFGSSGSGKSTFLNLIGGILKPSSGQIKINGTEITSLPPNKKDSFRANNLGVIFQQFNLLDYIPPIMNILLPCYFTKFKKKNKKYFYDRAFYLSNKLGLKRDILIRKKSKNLSVGQKQRIAIIRSIINEPKLILADEPTSALDNENKKKFLDLLFEVCTKEKITLLMVSHDTTLTNYFDENYSLEGLNRKYAHID